MKPDLKRQSRQRILIHCGIELRFAPQPNAAQAVIGAVEALEPAGRPALPEAVAMATRAPALAAGMADRGVIAEGMRADLVRVRRIDGRSWIRAVWRGGRRVL